MHSSTKEWVGGLIRAHVSSSHQNRLRIAPALCIYDEPLVGFVSGADPLWAQYKAIIGEFHLTPAELFRETTGNTVGGNDLTVISWILPFTHMIISSNAAQTHGPSEYWAHSRRDGEIYNDLLRAYVAAELTGAGFEAIAPVLGPGFRRLTAEHVGLASTWSERHAAYAAGLGAFGLSGGLISRRGVAMRCGSVVARLELQAARVTRPKLRGYCSFFQEGSCRACVSRCPAAAISTDRGPHDKERCRDFSGSIRVRIEKLYGIPSGEASGCGLCQTGVPCSERIPSGIAPVLY